MKKATKKQRKLLKGGNAMVKISIKLKNKVGDYFGRAPIYFNKAKIGEVDNYVKVAAGVPFVRAELHGL